MAEKKESRVGLELILMLLTCVALITAYGFFAARFDEWDVKPKFEYEMNEDGTYTLKKYNGSAETLEIPDRYSGKAVTSIGTGAFEHCGSLVDVTIPDSVTISR